MCQVESKNNFMIKTDNKTFEVNSEYDFKDQSALYLQVLMFFHTMCHVLDCYGQSILITVRYSLVYLYRDHEVLANFECNLKAHFWHRIHLFSMLNSSHQHDTEIKVKG